MSLIAVYLPALFNRLRLPLYRNAMYILWVNSLPGILGIVFWWIASRLYSAEEIGLGAAIISAIVLVSGIAGLGTFAGVIRFLPEAKEPVHFLNSMYTLILLSSSFAGGLYLTGIQIWTPNLLILQTNTSYMLVFMLAMLMTPLSTLVIHTFIAQRCSHYASLFVAISNILRLALVYFFVRQGAIGVVASIALALLVSLAILMYLFLPRILPDYVYRWSWDTGIYKAVLPYSVGNYIVSLIAQLAQTLLPIMILEGSGPQANAYAYIPLQLSFATTTFGFSLATSAFAEAAHQDAKSGNLLMRSTILGLVISAILTFIILIGAPVFMGWFGAVYAQESTGLLRLAALAGPFMVLNQNYYTQLRLQKRIRQLTLLSLACFTLTLGSTSLLLPRVGIEASGIGLLMGHASVSLWIFYLIRRGAGVFLCRNSRLGNEVKTISWEH